MLFELLTLLQRGLRYTSVQNAFFLFRIDGKMIQTTGIYVYNLYTRIIRLIRPPLDTCDCLCPHGLSFFSTSGRSVCHPSRVPLFSYKHATRYGVDQ